MKVEKINNNLIVGKYFLGGILIGACCEIFSSKKTSYSSFFAMKMGILGSIVYCTKKVFFK